MKGTSPSGSGSLEIPEGMRSIRGTFMTKGNVVLIVGFSGFIIGAVVASLFLAALGPGIRWPISSEPAFWPGLTYATGGMGMMGPGMMSGSMGLYQRASMPISREEAERRAAEFARGFGEGYIAEDLMGFTENYYAVIEEESSGAAITEILVDRYTGRVTLEPGPAMMWRVRAGTSSAPPAYDLEAARSLADVFLGGYLPGSRIVESHSFPGHYTFDFGRNGTEGMLSVNAYSGGIWVHTWHGLSLPGG
jgi:hypothetical protein